MTIWKRQETLAVTAANSNPDTEQAEMPDGAQHAAGEQMAESHRELSAIARMSRQPASSGVTEGREIRASVSASASDMVASVAQQVVQAGLGAGLRVDEIGRAHV